MRRMTRMACLWLVGSLLTTAPAATLFAQEAGGSQGEGDPQEAGNPGGLEVRLVPDEFLIPNTARHVGLGYQGASSYYDVVLQVIYFINRSEGPLAVEGGEIELLAEGEVLQTTAISMLEVGRVQAQAAAIAGMGFEIALTVLYDAGDALPEGVTLSATPNLAPNTAGLVDDYYLVVRSLPDEVRVTIRARDAAGNEVLGVASQPVRPYETKNDYILPVEAGEWFLTAYPGLEGHHRWSVLTEHAWDITMVDSRGSWAKGETGAWRGGTVPEWEGWHAYDKKVLAAADGVVVKVYDQVEFPLELWNRQEGESLADYRGRLDQQQMQLFMTPGTDPAAVAGGNHLMIEHEGGEISYYAHLAYSSIRVKEGDRVQQGQHIAGLGGTGEAPMVHLHFQVMDRSTLDGVRTYPVTFRNIEVNQPYADDFAPDIVFEPGFFVVATDP